MTNRLLLLAATAGTLAFASCQNEGSNGLTDEMMQAKIDSAVQSRMEEMQAQLAAQNDSLINALAMMKADSMMAAAGNSNTGMRRTVTTRPTTTRPTTPTTPKTTTPAPTGKNNGDQGDPTGKRGATNAEGQTNEGTPTGKRR